MQTTHRQVMTGQGMQGILATMDLDFVIERDIKTGLLVGSVPGIPGAHTQGETPEEVQNNLREVIELLREEHAFVQESEFLGTARLTLS